MGEMNKSNISVQWDGSMDSFHKIELINEKWDCEYYDGFIYIFSKSDAFEPIEIEVGQYVKSIFGIPVVIGEFENLIKKCLLFMVESIKN